MRKKMSVREFWELGYLQEVNRRILHPCGLALSVAVDNETGDVRFGDIWDSREDEEGFVFVDKIDPEKAGRVWEEYNRHLLARTSLLGGMMVQPVPRE